MGACLRLALLAACLGCVAPSQPYYVPNATPVEQLDWSVWDAMLRDHVRDGVVDYGGFATDARFEPFLLQLRRSRLTAETTRPQRLAFYLNAYNASAIRGILTGGSPETRRGRRRFFERTRHDVGSESITLWDLEHHRIRTLGDPRSHFAIACAAASCPKLASEALVAERLDAQLERLARAFVNDPDRNRFDPEARVAHLSRIFDWYAEDFGNVPAYVASHLEDRAVAASLAAGGWEIRYLDFDWSLNGTFGN